MHWISPSSGQLSSFEDACVRARQLTLVAGAGSLDGADTENGDGQDGVDTLATIRELSLCAKSSGFHVFVDNREPPGMAKFLHPFVARGGATVHGHPLHLSIGDYWVVHRSGADVRLVAVVERKSSGDISNLTKAGTMKGATYRSVEEQRVRLASLGGSSKVTVVYVIGQAIDKKSAGAVAAFADNLTGRGALDFGFAAWGVDDDNAPLADKCDIPQLYVRCNVSAGSVNRCVGSTIESIIAVAGKSISLAHEFYPLAEDVQTHYRPWNYWRSSVPGVTLIGPISQLPGISIPVAAQVLNMAAVWWGRRPVSARDFCQALDKTRVWNGGSITLQEFLVNHFGEWDTEKTDWGRWGTIQSQTHPQLVCKPQRRTLAMRTLTATMRLDGKASQGLALFLGNVYMLGKCKATSLAAALCLASGDWDSATKFNNAKVVLAAFEEHGFGDTLRRRVGSLLFGIGGALSSASSHVVQIREAATSLRRIVAGRRGHGLSSGQLEWMLSLDN